MSKAEERGKIYALHKASEKLHDYYGNAMLSVVQFDGRDIKNAYRDGYHQAEKDNELTWRDIEQILDIINNLVDENFNADDFGIPANKEFYQEVLKRFKETRNERPV